MQDDMIVIVATMVFLMMTFVLGPVCAQQEDDALIDHGVAVPLAESRGAVATEDANGNSLAICCSLDMSPRGWILVTDIDSEESTQVWYPEGVPNSAPYGSVLAKTGKFYTAASRHLLEFDPTTRDWSWHGVPSPDASAYLRIIEAPDGTIWGGDVYRAGLISFDPDTRETKDHGRLDEAQKYLSSLAVDDSGWLYGGIGTQLGNIVAYNPETGEKIQIPDQDQRKVGSASVYRGTDGKVYGKATLKSGVVNYRLFAGKAEVIEAGDVVAKEPSGDIGWGQKSGTFPDGRKLTRYDLVNRWLDIYDPATKQTKRIEIDYESEGSTIRVITGGPDGKVYGNSAHPSRNFVLDPVEGVPHHREGAIAVKGYAVQGKYVIGGHYGGGRLYIYDTTRPWHMAAISGTVAGGIGAKPLTKLASTDAGKIDYLSSYDIVLFRADDYGGQIHFDIPAEADGDYYLIIALYKSPGYCTVQFSLDGKTVGEPYEGCAKVVEPGPHQVAGPFPLKAGKHRVSVETIKAEAGNPWIGISTIALTQQKPDEAIRKAERANPYLAAVYSPDINVPWGAAAHPDGKHVMISGKPGYGYIGGGIGIYNIETDEELLLKHEDLIPGQSIVAMAPLENGDIVCGTSISGGHGTTAVAKTAVLFILDWKTKEISWQTPAPVNATEIGLLKKGSDGLIYGIAGSTLFVFDQQKKEVVHTAPLGDYGGRTVNGMACGPDGNIYLVFTKAILRVKPGSFEVEKIAEPPANATAGIAVVAGRVYFAIGSHLWSAKL